MCCDTHDLRDALALAAAREAGPGDVALFESLAAPGEGWRCRCGHGVPCRRKADAEDLLCAWCRETGHAAWYAERMREAAAARDRSFEVPGPVLEGRGLYFGDFYAAGKAGSFAFDAGTGPVPFEFPADAFSAGLRGMRLSAEGALAPSEISSILGLPNL